MGVGTAESQWRNEGRYAHSGSVGWGLPPPVVKVMFMVE